MSTNLEPPRLNWAGQFVLAGTASLFANGVAHPMGTIKNRLMAGTLHSVRDLRSLRGLYHGYWAICGADAATFSAAYLTNDLLRDRGVSLWPAVMAGLIPSPFVAIGEGLMANRQVNAMGYSQIAARAFRLHGFIATAFREVPFTTALFYATPLLEGHLVCWSREEEPSAVSRLGIQIAAGGITGFTAGFLTAPIDHVKTLVQTSHRALSIPEAVRREIALSGWRGLWRGGPARGVYVGLAMACMNIVNHTLPAFLPEALHSRQQPRKEE